MLTFTGLGAAGAFSGQSVDLTVDNVEIIRVSGVHFGGFSGHCVRIVGDTELFVLFVGTGVFLALVLEATIGGVGRDPRVASGIIQRDGEREGIVAIQDLLEACNDGNKGIM